MVLGSGAFGQELGLDEVPGVLELGGTSAYKLTVSRMCSWTNSGFNGIMLAGFEISHVKVKVRKSFPIRALPLTREPVINPWFKPMILTKFKLVKCYHSHIYLVFGDLNKMYVFRIHKINRVFSYDQIKSFWSAKPWKDYRTQQYQIMKICVRKSSWDLSHLHAQENTLIVFWSNHFFLNCVFALLVTKISGYETGKVSVRAACHYQNQ